MSALAALLVSVTLADLARHLTRRNWPAPVLGVAALLAVALLSGLWHTTDIVPMSVAAATCVGWTALGSMADSTGRHQWSPHRESGLSSLP